MHVCMFAAGGSTYHNLTVRGNGAPSLYDGYIGNFVPPTQPRSDASEAISASAEVSYSLSFPVSRWVTAPIRFKKSQKYRGSVFNFPPGQMSRRTWS